MAKQSQKQPPQPPQDPGIADQFSDADMEQIKRYGEALGGKPTPFDEEVDKWANIHERNYAKMRAAATGGSLELGPTEMEQTAARQAAAIEQQTGAQGAQAAAQAQAQQTPMPAPPAPSSPIGTTQPYPAQAREPMGGTEQPPAGTQQQPPGQPPAAPGP